MAKLINNKLADVLPYIGDTLIMGYRRGVMYAQSWPKKRKRPLPESTQIRNQWFKLANFMAKNAPAGEQRASMTYSPRGPLYPRDYILKSIAGNMYDLHLEDGTVIYGMPSIIETSKELDIVAQLTGMILVRGSQLWQPLAMGNPGECLTAPFSGSTPIYLGPGSTRGGHSMTQIEPNTVITSASATQLWGATLLSNIRVDSLVVHFDAINTATYKGKIVTLSGFNVATVVAETDEITATTMALDRRKLNFSEPILLSAGTKYGFAFMRTDSTSTTSPKTYNSTMKGNLGMPIAEDMGFARYNTTDLSASDTPANSGLTFPFTIDVIYRF